MQLVIIIIIIIIISNFGLQSVKIIPLNSIACQSISNKDRLAELFFPRLFSSRISGLFSAVLYWIYRGQSCADENILVFSSPFPQFYFSSFSGRRYIAEFQLRLQGFHSLSIQPQPALLLRRWKRTSTGDADKRFQY